MGRKEFKAEEKLDMMMREHGILGMRSRFVQLDSIVFIISIGFMVSSRR